AQLIDLGGVARPRRRGLAPVGRVGSDQRSCTPHAVREPARRPHRRSLWCVHGRAPCFVPRKPTGRRSSPASVPCHRRVRGSSGNIAAERPAPSQHASSVTLRPTDAGRKTPVARRSACALAAYPPLPPCAGVLFARF